MTIGRRTVLYFDHSLNATPECWTYLWLILRYTWTLYSLVINWFVYLIHYTEVATWHQFRITFLIYVDLALVYIFLITLCNVIIKPYYMYCIVIWGNTLNIMNLNHVYKSFIAIYICESINHILTDPSWQEFSLSKSVRNPLNLQYINLFLQEKMWKLPNVLVSLIFGTNLQI